MCSTISVMRSMICEQALKTSVKPVGNARLRRTFPRQYYPGCAKYDDGTKEGHSDDDKPILKLIDGVKIRPATTLHDERGTLCEILNPVWALHDAPIL